MVNDDERREVARRLRGIKDTREGCGHELCCDLWAAIFDSDYRCTDLCDECEVAVLDYLADLIEPNQDKIGTCPENVLKASGIDRHALLELADDIDKQTDGSMFDAWLEDGHYIARRIREAVGV